MKINGRNILATVIALGMLMMATTTRAQPSPAAQPPTPPVSTNDSNAPQAHSPKNSSLRTLLDNFSLTPLQKTQISNALITQRDKMMALKNDPSVTPENQMDKVRAIMDETDATLKKVFSPEQFQKWQDATKDMRPAGTTTGTNGAVTPKQ